MSTQKLRLGLMGFGHIGRQLYHLATQSDDIDIVAIADIGKPEILHYLLASDSIEGIENTLRGNYLVNSKFETRMLQTDRPQEVPWDIFNVDAVIDATGKFESRADMEAHLGNGAPRVLISTLPIDHIDRLIIAGVNDASARAEDRMISVGSATTAALALMLKVISDKFQVQCASVTSVHAYTSDQPLQDYAGKDFRRSRSAAENVIPNALASPQWVEKVLPQFAGKLSGHSLNVPVQKGSLLDLNLVFANEGISVEQINDTMRAAKNNYAGIIDVVEDPVVSSDVIGNRHSVVFDAPGTIKAGKRIIKTLSWYESLGHAARMLDVVRHYAAIDASGDEKCA